MQTSTLSPAAFSLLADLHRRLDGRRCASSDVLAAVGLLTAAAAPERAERLRPASCDPPVLVGRLASWALHRVDDAVIRAASVRLGCETCVAA